MRQICDERGKIMHMLRADDPECEQFGEVYFSAVYPGAIKGWHPHRRMVLNYAVPIGMIKLALYDARAESRTAGFVQELFVGESNYVRVRIPPGVYNGFRGLGDKMSIVANCATIAHDPEEIERLDPFSPEIPYSWDLKHG